jgi:hypothetical protein
VGAEHTKSRNQQIGDVPEEPFILREAERLLDSTDPQATSQVVDVALIFYTAVGTIIGTLCAACLYPMFHPFKGVEPAIWIFFLLCSVALGGAAGFGIMWFFLNARGLIAWEQRFRP